MPPLNFSGESQQLKRNSQDKIDAFPSEPLALFWLVTGLTTPTQICACLFTMRNVIVSVNEHTSINIMITDDQHNTKYSITDRLFYAKTHARTYTHRLTNAHTLIGSAGIILTVLERLVPLSRTTHLRTVIPSLYLYYTVTEVTVMLQSGDLLAIFTTHRYRHRVFVHHQLSVLAGCKQ